MPDPPTQKIPPATAPTEGTAGTAAAITVDAQGSENRFGLSVIQIVASTAAAVTAALIGSRLGVAGTLTGAALASVVSGVGAAVYGHSLLVTRRKMAKALRLVRQGTTPSAPAGAATAAPATPAAADRRPSHPRTAGPDDDPTVVIPRAGQPAAFAPRRSRRPLTVVLAGVAAAAVIFAGSMAMVTLVERVKGGPLSGGNSGLTILGGNTSPDTGTTTDATTVTATPSASSSGATAPTATVTQTLTPSPTVSSGTAPTSSIRSSAGTAQSSPPASTSAAGQSAATAPATAP
jgi:hypothetical protein